eukprot:5152160-Lingulodinium_polyedra.AAC.1
MSFTAFLALHMRSGETMTRLAKLEGRCASRARTTQRGAARGRTFVTRGVCAPAGMVDGLA